MKKPKYTLCSACGEKIHVDDLGVIYKMGYYHTECIPAGVKIRINVDTTKGK